VSVWNLGATAVARLREKNAEIARLREILKKERAETARILEELRVADRGLLALDSYQCDDRQMIDEDILSINAALAAARRRAEGEG